MYQNYRTFKRNKPGGVLWNNNVRSSAISTGVNLLNIQAGISTNCNNADLLMRICKHAMAHMNDSNEFIKLISEDQQATYVCRLALDLTFKVSTNHCRVPESRSENSVPSLFYNNRSEANMAMLDTATTKDIWLGDSGASHHMTHNMANYSAFSKLATPYKIIQV